MFSNGIFTDAFYSETLFDESCFMSSVWEALYASGSDEVGGVDIWAPKYLGFWAPPTIIFFFRIWKHNLSYFFSFIAWLL